MYFSVTKKISDYDCFWTKAMKRYGNDRGETGREETSQNIRACLKYAKYVEKL